MLIRTRRNWELPESAATPENVWMNRRAWLKGAGFAGLGLATSGLVPTAAMDARPLPMSDVPSTTTACVCCPIPIPAALPEVPCHATPST